MAQRETSSLLIKAQPLTSQHMLNELLKIGLTPRGGIKAAALACAYAICQLRG